MKRILIVLAGYALYRWLTKPQPGEPPIALPPPDKSRRPSRQGRT